MKIAIGCDHAGFSLKQTLKRHLSDLKHDVIDCGADSDAKSDYPIFAQEASRLVSCGKCERAVLVCGSGIGMCMAANRFSRVRAAVIRDEYDAQMSRSHNDANVACFGARLTAEGDAVHLLDVFLETPFEGGRHAARVAKIEMGR